MMKVALIAAVAISLFASMSAQTTTMNSLGERYVRLVLALGQHDADYVDAYYGPPEWKQDVAAEKLSLVDISSRAERLARDIAAAGPPAGADEVVRLRYQYLASQLEALRARAAMVAGTKMSFDEESRALYDAVAPRHTEAEFEKVLAELDAQLPGGGPLLERYETFRNRFIIPRDRLDATFAAAIDGCRTRTLQHMTLPAGESFTVEYVTGKSWSGYNWYQGNYRSLIQVNTDLPIYADRAIDLACHEGYPGHHVYNALLEKNLVRDRGWTEFSVYPLFSPQSLIAEGTANFGIEVAFPRADRLEFERRVIFPAAGLDPAGVNQYVRCPCARRSIVLCGQRGGAPVPQWRDRCEVRRRVAREVRAVLASARGAACPLHRSVPQLRDQLQPGQGPGRALHSVTWRHGRKPGAPLVRVRAAPFIAAASFGPRCQLPTPRFQFPALRYRSSVRALEVWKWNWEIDMICIEITKSGQPEVLKPAERPEPVPGRGEVLIAVAAAGVNRPDVMQRRGRYPPPPGASDIPGLEVAGTIVALGEDVTEWTVGDEVCALVAGGGYATKCVAPAPQCLPVPASLDLVTAAAIPETFFTVWTNVLDRGRLKSGETALIHGGSSGIGTTAIQLAVARGARVSPPPDQTRSAAPASGSAQRVPSITARTTSSNRSMA